jgi:hypothetical protein
MLSVLVIACTLGVFSGCAADQLTSAEKAGDYSVYSGNWVSPWLSMDTEAGPIDVRYNLDMVVASDGQFEAQFWVETRENPHPSRQSWSGDIDGATIKLLHDDFALECCPDVRAGSFVGRINDRFIRLSGPEFSTGTDGDLFLFSDR